MEVWQAAAIGWNKRLPREEVQSSRWRTDTLLRQKRNTEDQDGHRYDQMPSNGTRDPDGHQSGSGELSMQCGVLRAHLLLNLPSQSRMVRQGSLGLRAELDSGDDVLRGYTWALRSARSG